MTGKGEAARSQIIKMLAAGNFVSGEEIGIQLAISRVAVAKHIKKLAQLGLTIHSVPGKGYQLSRPLELLNAVQLSKLSRSPIQYDVQPVVTSTNDHVQQRLQQISPGYCCLAEAQTSGRGRQGKTWVSPFGGSIYMSMYWPFAQGFQSLNGLSLVVGVAISDVLTSFGCKGVSLKWPNDVYVDNRKIAGVLIELAGQVGATCEAVIGVGLNIDVADALQQQVDQPWTDVRRQLASMPSRNELVATLGDRLYTALEEFESDGFSPFMARWHKYDHLLEQHISIVAGQQQVEGTAKGVNNQGALLVETTQGMRSFYGGEISVRRK